VKIRPGTFIPPHLAHLYDPDKVEYPVRVEYKYDGSRLQLHKWGSSIWLFSRRAVEKSKTLPEIVEIVKEFNAHSCIVDSEVVAIDQEGKLLPFQSLLIRTVPRKYEKERAEEVRLTIKAFDILYLDGQDLTHLSLSKRLEFLEAVVPYQYLSDGRYCENDVEVIRFYQEALNKGLEGIIIKSLSSPYEIGKRTNRWLKLKPERDTLDCVIIKALYGKGRRAGYYSSYELAIRDPIQRKLYTVGRVSNVPDLLMARFRDIIERTKTSENREGVYVRPTIVLEVTYQEIQKTDEYTSGFALRVPKVVRVRDDKRVEDICTLEKLQKLYEMQYEERFKIKSL
jgi:DNA ligase-1